MTIENFDSYDDYEMESYDVKLTYEEIETLTGFLGELLEDYKGDTTEIQGIYNKLVYFL